MDTLPRLFLGGQQVDRKVHHTHISSATFPPRITLSLTHTDSILIHNAYSTLSNRSTKPSVEPYRLNVKTHVFKKELQEYVPTQLDDRLRIETIIYVELSIVDQADSSLVRNYDYVRLPKELFYNQPDKEMSAEEMASKRILNVEASLQCPSNNWQVETEACVRCARRMSAKLEQNESRVSLSHILSLVP